MDSKILSEGHCLASAIEASCSPEILVLASKGIILPRKWTTKALLRLRGCAGWSPPLLFTYGMNRFSHDLAQFIVSGRMKQSDPQFARPACLWLLHGKPYEDQRPDIRKHIKHINSRLMTKLKKWHVCPAKTQISLGSLIRVFAVYSVGSWGPNVSSRGQRRLWSDWADAQADLSSLGTRVILLVLSWLGSFHVSHQTFFNCHSWPDNCSLETKD